MTSAPLYRGVKENNLSSSTRNKSNPFLWTVTVSLLAFCYFSHLFHVTKTELWKNDHEFLSIFWNLAIKWSLVNNFKKIIIFWLWKMLIFPIIYFFIIGRGRFEKVVFKRLNWVRFWNSGYIMFECTSVHKLLNNSNSISETSMHSTHLTGPRWKVSYVVDKQSAGWVSKAPHWRGGQTSNEWVRTIASTLSD